MESRDPKHRRYENELSSPVFQVQSSSWEALTVRSQFFASSGDSRLLVHYVPAKQKYSPPPASLRGATEGKVRSFCGRDLFIYHRQFRGCPLLPTRPQLQFLLFV
ncbi:UNVERIFIED_CONTAM: hypothetical protein K2H54_068209 [Gekko kuhli]